MRKLEYFIMYYKKTSLIFLALFAFFLGQTTLQGQQQIIGKIDFNYINKKIAGIHSSIIKLSQAYKDKIDKNKLRMPVSFGHHNFFTDSEDYVYRNDAFLYFTGETLKDILFVYEQTHTNSLITEVRLNRLTNISKKPPFDLQVTYMTWAADEERTGQEAKDLIKFSDEINPPKTARVRKFLLQDIKKPDERSSLLFEYKKNLLRLERMMEYYLQAREQERKNKIKYGLKIGVRQ